MANIELLDLVMKTIEKDPIHWYQGDWRVQVTDNGIRSWIPSPIVRRGKQQVYKPDCHTAFCFAGWACELSGEPTDWSGSSSLWANEYDFPGETPDPEVLKMRRVSVSQRAQRVLDLDPWEARTLFNGTNTLIDLRRKIAAIKDNPINFSEALFGVYQDEEADNS